MENGRIKRLNKMKSGVGTVKVLLDKNKKFYKANLHCHSKYSDGKMSVEELKEAYKKRGYSIVAFTDHEHVIDNSRLDDENFLTITSCEVAIKEFENQSTLKNYGMRVCHLNFYALNQHNDITPCYSSGYDHFVSDEIKNLIKYEEEYKRNYSVDDINRMIEIANKKGFIVSYNHPSWSLENATHYLGYKNLFAVEIFNTSCVNLGIVDDEVVYDDLLRSGQKLWCTACDDNHNNYGFDSPLNSSFGGWVCINAKELSYDEVMRSLQNGDFYASTGPQISSLVKDGDTVTIECSPCKRISLVTGTRRGKVVAAENGKSISGASFTIRESDGYFRIRVEDEFGKKAYTQAYDVK